MAQPLSLSLPDLAPQIADSADFHAENLHGEGPANRALDELRLALAGEDFASHEEKWSIGASVRLIIFSCGLFWIAAALSLYAMH